MRTLGIDAEALDDACSNRTLYDFWALQGSVFFDRETFGADRLVVRKGHSREATQAFLAQSPLAEQVRRDILRIEHGDQDAMPGLTSAQKKDRLSRISYDHYLLKVLKADPGVLPYTCTAPTAGGAAALMPSQRSIAGARSTRDSRD